MCMKKILLLLVVAIFASFTSWAKYVYLYSEPRAASTVYVGTDINGGYFSNGFTFADVNPGETVYFAFSAFDGYTLTEIRYENLSSEDVTELSNGVYSFTMPDDRVKIYLYFEETPVVVTDVIINEENFPDANFRSWLLSQSYGTDGVITGSEIRNITIIDARSCGIEDLTGIEHFVFLNQLVVSNSVDAPQETWNRISAINISENSNLRKLDCEGNCLTQLDVTNNTNLQILFCADNRLTEIDLSGNAKLELLSCSGNQLTELDFSNNPLMDQVYCDNNLLTELNVSNKASLHILNCYNNQLTSLDLTGCTALYQLYFYNNQIRGEAMQAFVNSLEIPPYGGYMVVVDLDNEMQQNEMTKEQVAIARAKTWSVEGITGEDFVQYEGIDDNPSINGDVDGDGEVAISDVSALIDYLLSGGNIVLEAADADHDGEVAISDVSVLIDYLLSGNW